MRKAIEGDAKTRLQEKVALAATAIEGFCQDPTDVRLDAMNRALKAISYQGREERVMAAFGPDEVAKLKKFRKGYRDPVTRGYLQNPDVEALTFDSGLQPEFAEPQAEFEARAQAAIAAQAAEDGDEEEDEEEE